MTAKLPVSARKVRQAVTAQADAIVVLDSAIANIGNGLEDLRNIVDGHVVQLGRLPRAESSLWQRLRWLVVGR